MTVLGCDMGATRLKLGLVRNGQVLVNEVLPSRSELALADRLPELESPSVRT
jgi:glucokinase